ncbi:MAG UNVERIFIED_CONTAM: hypothetical protein LVR18_11125 [Planctomycetaceae bacterium]|jgi:DNA-directed RNA polymerase subunit H (RpoH/RPB5)
MNHVQRVAAYLPQIEAADPSSVHAGTTPGSFARDRRESPLVERVL